MTLARDTGWTGAFLISLTLLLACGWPWALWVPLVAAFGYGLRTTGARRWAICAASLVAVFVILGVPGVIGTVVIGAALNKPMPFKPLTEEEEKVEDGGALQ